MNTKHRLLVLPIASAPYLLLAALAVIFFSADNAAMQFIMEKIFHGDGLLLLSAVLIYAVISAALCIAFTALSLRRTWNALSVAKVALIVKLIQIPAYVFTFGLGLVFAITLFTLPFAAILLLLNYATLILTGLLTAAAAINAVRQHKIAFREAVCFILSQLFFCADIIGAALFFRKLLRASND